MISKGKPIEHLDYIHKLLLFKDSDDVVFIPDEQRNGNRYHWHNEAHKIGLYTLTIRIRRHIDICGIHHKPIIGTKWSVEDRESYDSDYECNYENINNDYDYCYRDKCVYSMLRTVIIFKDSNIKDKNQIRQYLIDKNIITLIDGKSYIK